MQYVNRHINLHIIEYDGQIDRWRVFEPICPFLWIIVLKGN